MRDYVQTSAEGRVGVVGCTEMCAQVQHAARIRDGHLEPARSGDADDSEGAESDSASPRRRCLHDDRGLLGLGLGLGLGLLDLDLERAELVVTSKVAMVLQERGGGLTRMSTRRRSAVGSAGSAETEDVVQRLAL